MSAYNSFAMVYDAFMDNIPYNEWFNYLHDLLIEHGVKDGIILDLGCGTGNITIPLSQCGYDMIGLDNSLDMLNIARSKNTVGDKEILYLYQDMREFELYGTVNAVVSICDSINYITDPNELVNVFKLVNNYLDPKGLFIFDFNSKYYYENILGDNTFAEDREDISFIWDNFYDNENYINEFDLNIFVSNMLLDENDSTDSGLYKKFTETHYQRGYDLKEIKDTINKSGLKFITAYDAFTKDSPSAESTRIYVIAQESGK